MDVQELIQEAPAVVSVVAAIGIALLLPLYLSQRRDVQRLRAWMEREPDHPETDLAASELLLDRAESELEELLGVSKDEGAPQAAPAPHEEGARATTPLPAATRVTHERPALERITTERAALAPHPRWRRFKARAAQPRVLVVVGIVALALGVAGIVVSEQILRDGDDRAANGGGRIERADVTVTVLNGTAVSGLGQTVATEVESNGYTLGSVGGASDPGFERTAVRFAEGQRAAARRVSRDLGLDPARAQPFDRETRLLAGGADVVVIAGEDRVRP